MNTRDTSGWRCIVDVEAAVCGLRGAITLSDDLRDGVSVPTPVAALRDLLSASLDLAALGDDWDIMAFGNRGPRSSAFSCMGGGG